MNWQIDLVKWNATEELFFFQLPKAASVCEFSKKIYAAYGANSAQRLTILTILSLYVFEKPRKVDTDGKIYELYLYIINICKQTVQLWD